mmetsp:Transcript_2892/g.6980  ORF Transcript_2892/g.6980 Transcript_2892/m.6980 type:complete len:90 (-) Transcript_2892:187-456(-)
MVLLTSSRLAKPAAAAVDTASSNDTITFVTKNVHRRVLPYFQTGSHTATTTSSTSARQQKKRDRAWDKGRAPRFLLLRDWTCAHRYVPR